jgi:osomolarity two-component system sensor histidine kinase SLN1
MVQQAAAASSSHVVSNGPTFLDEIEKRRETLAQNSKLGEEGGGRLHFMVVDDTSADRRAIMQMLVGEGQIVSEAVDGMDCLQMYEESLDRGEIIDVIIMDSEMPYVSGKKAATMLRSKGFTGAIFGLLEEGTSFVDLETRSLMASGVDAVLMKPLSLDVLHAEYVAWVASRNGDGEVDNSSNPTGLAVES